MVDVAPSAIASQPIFEHGVAKYRSDNDGQDLSFTA